MADQETIQAMRRTVIALLQDLAGGGTTSSLGRCPMYSDSVSELMCMWFDDCGLETRLQNLEKDGLFSRDEIAAMVVVTQALRRLKSSPVDNINRIEPKELWYSVVDAAQTALAKIKSSYQ